MAAATAVATGKATPAGAADQQGKLEFRTLRIHDKAFNAGQAGSHRYADNSISTARYSILTFFPVNLWEFFRIVANVYFLVISLLQLTTNLSPTNEYSTIMPLVIVFCITLAKNGAEDYKRHVADAEINARTVTRVKSINAQLWSSIERSGIESDAGQNRQAHSASKPPTKSQQLSDQRHAASRVLRSVSEQPAWRDLRVGDIVLVKEGDELPADVLILGTSEEGGKCFTETANLDGETNLKRKQALRATSEAIGQRESPKEDPIQPWILLGRASMLHGEVQYELPNDRLYTFVGAMTLKLSPEERRRSALEPDPSAATLEASAGSTTMRNPTNGAGSSTGSASDSLVSPIGPENVLLRGCKLSSCAHAIGLVLFTGNDTKLMKNQRHAPSKVSNVYSKLNRLIFMIFLVQLVLIIVSTVAFFLYTAQAVDLAQGGSAGYWYLDSVLEGGTGASVVSFVTFLILYNNLVPISLYVSLDIIKVTQAKQIEMDRAMAYDPALDDPYLAIERRKRFRRQARAEAGNGNGSGAGDRVTSSSRRLEAPSRTESGSIATDLDADLDLEGPLPPAADSELKFAKARTSDLNEDLGQIEYIFSDKTGTLTRNMMEFRKCSVGGVSYGFGTTEIGRAAMQRAAKSGENADRPTPGVLSGAIAERLSNPELAQAFRDVSIAFDDPRLLMHLQGEGHGGLAGAGAGAGAGDGEEGDAEIDDDDGAAAARRAWGTPEPSNAINIDEGDEDEDEDQDQDENNSGKGILESRRSRHLKSEAVTTDKDRDTEALVAVRTGGPEGSTRESGTQDSAEGTRGSRLAPSATPSHVLLSAGESGEATSRMKQHRIIANARGQGQQAHATVSLSEDVEDPQFAEFLAELEPREQAALGAAPPSGQSQRLHDFLVCLGVCHTVIPETSNRTGKLVFRASSPDEEALVKAAQCLGYGLVTAAPDVTLRLGAQAASAASRAISGGSSKSREEAPLTRGYVIVGVNEFNSDRKRMSVVARRRAPDGTVLPGGVLFCKGADNKMLELITDWGLGPKRPRASAGLPLRGTATGGGEEGGQGEDEVGKSNEDSSSDSESAAGPTSDGEQQQSILIQHLKQFAQEGLRTLVCAKRELTEAQVKTWEGIFQEAASSLTGREEHLAEAAAVVETEMSFVGATAIEDKLQQGVPDTIATLARAGINIWVLTGDKVETAVNISYACRLFHDRMSRIHMVLEGVQPLTDDESVQATKVGKVDAGDSAIPRHVSAADKAADLKRRLHLAHLHFVREQLRTLTRDPRSPCRPHLLRQGLLTREEIDNPIAASAGGDDMLASHSEGTDVGTASQARAGAREDAAALDLAEMRDAQKLAQSLADSPTALPELGLVLSGQYLAVVFDGEHSDDQAEQAEAKLLLRDLLRVARCCKAVVACRVSPKQKAAVVRMVQQGVVPKPLTLAIGDGANDVAMIQTAQVGVGISGQEGVQAVNSSDYAIAQFRYLRRLLLWHGRMNYQRISRTILYSFYKNVALVMVLFIFNFWNAFSGTTYFESFVQAGWNFFTALPILAIGIFDYDVPADQSEQLPGLYGDGQVNGQLNIMLFARWIANAAFHAVVVFFVTLPVVQSSPWDPNGLSGGLFSYGLGVYACLMFSMQLKAMLLARVWTFWFDLSLLLSFAMFFIFCFVYGRFSYVVSNDFLMVPYEVFSWPRFWLLVVLVPVATLLVDFGMKAAGQGWSPGLAGEFRAWIVTNGMAGGWDEHDPESESGAVPAREATEENDADGVPGPAHSNPARVPVSQLRRRAAHRTSMVFDQSSLLGRLGYLCLWDCCISEVTHAPPRNSNKIMPTQVAPRHSQPGQDPAQGQGHALSPAPAPLTDGEGGGPPLLEPLKPGVLMPQTPLWALAQSQGLLHEEDLRLVSQGTHDTAEAEGEDEDENTPKQTIKVPPPSTSSAYSQAKAPRIAGVPSVVTSGADEAASAGASSSGEAGGGGTDSAKAAVGGGDTTGGDAGGADANAAARDQMKSRAVAGTGTAASSDIGPNGVRLHERNQHGMRGAKSGEVHSQSEGDALLGGAGSAGRGGGGRPGHARADSKLHATRTWFGPSYRAPTGSSFYGRQWRTSTLGPGQGTTELDRRMGLHEGGDHLGFDYSAANTSSYFSGLRGASRKDLLGLGSAVTGVRQSVSGSLSRMPRSASSAVDGPPSNPRQRQRLSNSARATSSKSFMRQFDEDGRGRGLKQVLENEGEQGSGTVDDLEAGT